jgi:hypothetical protein
MRLPWVTMRIALFPLGEVMQQAPDLAVERSSRFIRMDEEMNPIRRRTGII